MSLIPKFLDTRTEVTINGNSIGIYTAYLEGLKLLKAFVSDKFQNVGNILFKENELGIINQGYKDVSFFIDSSGNLISLSNSNKTFSINDEGELIMEETI